MPQSPGKPSSWIVQENPQKHERQTHNTLPHVVQGQVAFEAQGRKQGKKGVVDLNHTTGRLWGQPVTRPITQVVVQ
jgi:hypothetical protein